MVKTSSALETQFEKIGQYEGAHQVIDTQWEDFLGAFKNVNVSALLESLRHKPGKISVLDEGCGSSLTLFEAIEDLEDGRRSGSINGYGITASTDHLSQAVPEPLRKQVLERRDLSTTNKKRLKLLMDGVTVDAAHGYHRYTPGGNLISIAKADVHSVGEVFPDQKFDLIYSSNAYPHFANPRLAFEESCNALSNAGVLLVDSLPIQACPSEYLEALQTKNPGYRISPQPSDDPFYQAIVVQKATSLNLTQ